MNMNPTSTGPGDRHGFPIGHFGLDSSKTYSVGEHLKSARKRLEDIELALDQTSVVAFTDANGVITYANDKFCELYGYNRTEILGNTHRMFKSGYHSAEFYKSLWDTITRGQIWRGEIKNRAKNGTEYWAFATIVPFLDLTGNPYQYLSIRTDITALKEAEERRIQLVHSEDRIRAAEEAIAIRDQFVSVAAHELKTPLTSLQIRLELLLRDSQHGASIPSDRIMKVAESSLVQTRRLSGLINDMLDVSRISAGKLKLEMSRLDLTLLVRELIAECSEDLRVAECEIAYIGNAPVWGVWDRSRIEQVVINLMTNAMKYGRGKPIEVEVRGDALKATLSVRDYGIGIPEDFMNTLFERFERTEAAEKFKGTGLGLWITKQIVTAHRGEIRVRSRVNEGSTFEVELPSQQSPIV